MNGLNLIINDYRRIELNECGRIETIVYEQTELNE